MAAPSDSGASSIVTRHPGQRRGLDMIGGVRAPAQEKRAKVAREEEKVSAAMQWLIINPTALPALLMVLTVLPQQIRLRVRLFRFLFGR